MNMNTKLALCMTSIAVLAASGCVSPYYRQANSAATREKTEIRNLKDDVARLQHRIEAAEVRLEERDSQSAGEKGSGEKELRELKESVAAIDRQLKAGEIAHADLKREIIAELSKRIAEQLPQIVGGQAGSSHAGTPRRNGDSSVQAQGKDHVVQAGETLTAIATAHKVKIGALIQANNLKNADSIRVGQKLVIPIQE